MAAKGQLFTPIHTSKQRRQNPNQQFQGSEEYDYVVDRKTGPEIIFFKICLFLTFCIYRTKGEKHKKYDEKKCKVKSKKKKKTKKKG